MLGIDPASMTPGRMTYHLRRLRLHGLIERTPHTNRYRVTDFGLRAALVLTRVHNRFLTTVMADAAPTADIGPPDRTALARALAAVATEIDNTATRLRLQAA
jgi:predicted MarR family transcription regulator